MTLPAWMDPRRYLRVTSGGDYVPQIDGLRFLAIIPVLFFHAGLRGERMYPAITAGEHQIAQYLPEGSLGVSLFFFISGYIIAYPFLAGRAPTLKRFYGRRLLRLEPPYIIAMLASFVVLSLGVHPGSAPGFNATEAPLWQSLLASLTYTHGFIFGEHPKLNPPAWSLEREIQFYLLAPFLLAAYLKLSSRHARLIVGGILAVAALILGQVITTELAFQHPLRHSLLAESYGFMLGILVCDYAVTARPFQGSKRAIFDVGFAIGLVAILLSGAWEVGRTLPEAILNSGMRAGAILLLFFGAARGPIAFRLLGNAWVALIGGACYSIYLVHVPVMQATATIMGKFVHPTSLWMAWGVSWTVLIPTALAAGMIFYVLIERPCMNPRWPNAVWSALKRITARNGDHSTTT